MRLQSALPECNNKGRRLLSHCTNLVRAGRMRFSVTVQVAACLLLVYMRWCESGRLRSLAGTYAAALQPLVRRRAFPDGLRVAKHTATMLVTIMCIQNRRELRSKWQTSVRESCAKVIEVAGRDCSRRRQVFRAAKEEMRVLWRCCGQGYPWWPGVRGHGGAVRNELLHGVVPV